MEHAIQDDPQGRGEHDTSLRDWQWLGQVARRIVLDAGLADDARQAAWMSVHGASHGSGALGTRRGRLYWALRSFVSRERTSSSRRRRREREAAAREALPSTEELILRGEQQQRVWQALKELPEPLQGTLLLHFQDGLTANEIAARSNIKADTVRRRLQRGLATLRGRLEADREAGGLGAIAAAMSTGDALVAARPWAAAMGANTGLAAGTWLWLKAALALSMTGALLAAGWGLLQGPEQAPQEGSELEVALAISAPTAASEPAPVGPSGPEPGPRTSAQRKGEAQASSAPAPGALRVITRTARVLIHDHRGQLISDQASGVLQASLRRDTSRRRIELPFHKGRVELRLRKAVDGAWLLPGLHEEPIGPTGGAELHELRLEIDGGQAGHHGVVACMDASDPAKLLRSWDWQLGGDEPALMLRTTPYFRLNVVDGIDPSIHLDDVEVFAATGQADRCLLGAGRRRTCLAESRSSPLMLEPGLAQVRLRAAACFVRSPGYAWARVDLDLRSGAERTVALHRSGSLRVTIQGELPEATRLSVRSSLDKSWPLADLLVRSKGEFDFEGVPVGDARVTLKLGTMFDSVTPLAEDNIRVEQGVQGHVHLIAPAPPARQLAPVSLDLRIPAAWDLKDPSLRIHKTPPLTGDPHEQAAFRISSLKESDRFPGQYRFDAGPLVPGNYSARLTELEYQVVLVVPPEGLVDELVEVPEPVSITAVVLDPVTLAVVEDVDTITWTPASSSYGGTKELQRVTRGESSGDFRFPVTRGPIELAISRKGVRSTPITVEAVEGMHVELFAERSTNATVELRHKGRALPWPGGFNVLESARTVEGTNRISGAGIAPKGLELLFTGPGRYRFTPPVLDGFTPADPVEFFAGPGQAPVLTIEFTAISIDTSRASADR